MSIVISGRIDGLEKDLAELEKQFGRAVGVAMGVLENDMEACLREHIENDVYDQFDPKEYIRRRENGGLLDFGAGHLQKGGAADRARIEYTPSGEDPQWRNPANGDEMIRRIESQTPPYDWARHPGDRPFFRNFVSEMIEGGRAETVFVGAVNEADPALGVTSYGPGAERDGNEWDG